jgi:hypothetical protein
MLQLTGEELQIFKNESLTGKGRNISSEKGSAITTKRNVTGSDYDGQVTDE